MSLQPLTQSFYKNGTVDIKRFGLTILDKPGEFKFIDKKKLFIDPSYQRTASKQRVKLINKNWSWLAFGVVIVARRKDGFFVVDGQHRVLAALTRDDITTIPCMVFEVDNIKQEAEGFLTSQVGRKPLSSYDRFAAQIIAGNKAAIKVKELLDSQGLFAANYTSKTSGNAVKCLSCLMQWVNYDSSVFEKIWPVIVRVCKGNNITDRIVHGFAYLANYAEDEGILNTYWEKRIVSIPYQNYIQSIHKALDLYNSGGERTYAIGIAIELNKRGKSKIKIKGVEM